MKTSASLLLLLAAALAPASARAAEPVFRAPRTVAVRTTPEQVARMKFEKTPFVYEGSVFLFRGETFGLNLDFRDGAISSLRYQPEPELAEVVLSFTQPEDEVPMRLTVQNKTAHPLSFAGVLSIPGKKELVATRIKTVAPGQTETNTWEHAIFQLMLHQIQVAKP